MSPTEELLARLEMYRKMFDAWIEVGVEGLRGPYHERAFETFMAGVRGLNALNAISTSIPSA